MKKKLLLVVSISLMSVACSTVTIHPEKESKLSSAPSYQDSKAFFLWGLIGEQRVDVNEICQGNGVRQMQSQQTFVDGVLLNLTLGLYAPHSVKVWCK
jgi:hypothetical protein